MRFSTDFHDFYTIKSLWEGDFGVKIKNFNKTFRGSFGAAKFLTHMLSLILKVHKIENFFGSEFEFYTISLLVMLKY